MDKVLKWSWLPLLVILLVSCAYIITDNWESISTVEMLDRGGYLYDTSGEVVGLWDGWSAYSLPAWLLPIAVPFFLVVSSPLWFKIVFPVAGLTLLYLYVLPHICSTEGDRRYLNGEV